MKLNIIKKPIKPPIPIVCRLILKFLYNKAKITPDNIDDELIVFLESYQVEDDELHIVLVEVAHYDNREDHDIDQQVIERTLIECDDELQDEEDYCY